MSEATALGIHTVQPLVPDAASPASTDWRTLLRDAQTRTLDQSEEAKISRNKELASVRIFEKMNLSDRRPWGTFNPGGATVLAHGLSASDAARVLQARIDKWKAEYGADKLLYSRVWPGTMQKAPNLPVMPDGWIYMEAYFMVPDTNVTYRAVLSPDESVLAY